MSGAIPSLPKYALMAWCSVKAQGQLLQVKQPYPWWWWWWSVGNTMWPTVQLCLQKNKLHYCRRLVKYEPMITSVAMSSICLWSWLIVEWDKMECLGIEAWNGLIVPVTKEDVCDRILKEAVMTCLKDAVMAFTSRDWVKPWKTLVRTEIHMGPHKHDRVVLTS
jgi:hypothetical protein